VVGNTCTRLGRWKRKGSILADGKKAGGGGGGWGGGKTHQTETERFVWHFERGMGLTEKQEKRKERERLGFFVLGREGGAKKNLGGGKERKRGSRSQNPAATKKRGGKCRWGEKRCVALEKKPESQTILSKKKGSGSRGAGGLRGERRAWPWSF